jgi:hypothetical protein
MVIGTFHNYHDWWYSPDPRAKGRSVAHIGAMAATMGAGMGSGSGPKLPPTGTVKQTPSLTTRLANPDIMVEGQAGLQRTGPPNGVGAVRGKGGRLQVRVYDENGNASIDIDWGHDHGGGDPHFHTWKGGVRGSETRFLP